MRKEDLQSIAVAAALNAGIDPALVCAVIATESSWDPWAIHYEPGFFTRYVAHLSFSDTEKSLRAHSFGLMQIMGQVAREQGYGAKFLSTLLDPLDNVTEGCKKLKRCLESEHDDQRNSLLRWNGGGNANYPQLVMNHYNSYAYLNSATRGAAP